MAYRQERRCGCLLSQERGARYARDLPPLTAETILAWADAHRLRTGKWPTSLSGRIPAAPNENWQLVGRALRGGLRGLPGKSTLIRFLAANGRTRHSDVVRRRRRGAAATGPVGVEELAAGTVDSFVVMGPEIVALGLQQVGGEPFAAVAVEIGQGRGHGRGGDSAADRGGGRRVASRAGSVRARRENTGSSIRLASLGRGRTPP